jgi:hypothetical protein
MANAEAKKIGTGSYIVTGLGFVPLIGVPFAIIAIILGLIKLKAGGRRLIGLGCLGILCTVVPYGALIYFGFVERGGIYDKLREDLARTELTELVKDIEHYKVVNGRDPESLLELQASLSKDKFNHVYDLTRRLPFDTPPSKGPTFYYQLTGDKSHYYLLAVGADQRPLTSDDVLPDLPEQDRVKTGLLINPSSLPAR